MRVKPKTILFTLLILLAVFTTAWFFYLSPALKQQQFVAALNQPEAPQRLAALKKYLNCYPDSPNRPQAYLKILQLQYHDLNQKTAAVLNWSAWLTHHPTEEEQQALLSFYRRLEDTLSSPATAYRAYTSAPRRVSAKLQRILFLYDFFLKAPLADSCKHAELLRLTELLIQSDWPDPRGYLLVAEALFQLDTVPMIKQSSRLLQKAININSYDHLSQLYPGQREKSLRQHLTENYYDLYHQLSRNAYQLDNYPLALHLISQAAKYKPQLPEEALALWKSIAAKLDNE